MDYTNHAFANVKNNTGVPIKSLTLYHQYDKDTPESHTWSNIAGGVTTGVMRVGYNTGFIRTGQDHWWAEYVLLDDSRWVAKDHIWETLHPADEGTVKTFTVEGSEFHGFRTNPLEPVKAIQLHRQQSPQYNTWAAVVIRNDFPVPVQVTLKHKYSNDVTFEHVFDPLAPGATTSPEKAYIAYYNTGFITTGSDYWDLSVKLDIPPYDNDPAKAFAAFTNASSHKGCMLKASDNGRTQTFSLNGAGVKFGIGSGDCFDVWKTWHGYDTLAFIRVMNDFPETISTVVLSHQYSSDTTWVQTRGLIGAGRLTPYMVVEYNTGFLRTGKDYWTVNVYLKNGKVYANHKPGKECFLTTADALDPSIFNVSESTFSLQLISGGCTDSMDYKGLFSPNAGRDVARPYNQNAYIGSHNAFANFAAGYYIAQQADSVDIQLARGSTTLLLDIWYRPEEKDIYLLHGGALWNAILQPFAVPQKLSAVLLTIKRYLEMQELDPVTIIFEDRVEEPHQHLIKKAFETSDTWNMTFNPHTYDVGTNGWPTLAGFFARATPLIVLTSNRTSADFAFQWDYMSENVFGNASLNQATWLNPRDESRPLSELALCALNHFPTLKPLDSALPAWLTQAAGDNDVAVLSRMIDACFTRWNRYPNYVNADFWTIPENGLIPATVYMNQMLHGTPAEVIRFQHGWPILTEIDDSRRLQGNWNRETGWIDRHFSEICPRPDPDKPGPVAYQIDDAINLALVVSVLQSVLPAGETDTTAWIHKTLRELVRYLLDIEPAVIAALGGESAAFDQLCAIPYLLIERATGITFEVTGIIRRRLRQEPLDSGHDRLLLAGLAGQAEGAAARLTEQLAATRAATAGTRTASGTYDLTHEILYLALIGPGAPADASLVTLLDSLLSEIMPENQDLGAEILACHWLAGGQVTATSRAAAAQLKAFSEGQEAECETGRDGECRCPRFKEQIHGRLTMVLGLGMTLSAAPAILEPGEEEAGRV